MDVYVDQLARDLMSGSIERIWVYVELIAFISLSDVKLIGKLSACNSAVQYNVRVITFFTTRDLQP